jgi:hypothetical protein
LGGGSRYDPIEWKMPSAPKKKLWLGHRPGQEHKYRNAIQGGKEGKVVGGKYEEAKEEGRWVRNYVRRTERALGINRGAIEMIRLVKE